MIVIDLKCSRDHYFEGWFAGLEVFYQQQRDGEIQCPICDDHQISRILSPVAIRRHGEAPRQTVPEANPEVVLTRQWQELKTYLQEQFEEVGTDFAKEALKMHYGAAEKRNIKGSSTAQEEEVLQKEGVEFFKIPVPKEGN
jgi:hypothetical protein